MFTGIIREVGKIETVEKIAGGNRLKIRAVKIIDEINVQDSVCVNGVCLTVVKKENNGFWVDTVGATLDKTTFANPQLKYPVNLELAMKLNDRLGGHLVLGHVNGIGTIKKITPLGENYWLTVQVPNSLEKYLIDEGSIAIDGISLTIATLNDSDVGISIIPHTWNNTNLNKKKVGDKVNIETDVLSKYIESLIKKDNSINKNKLTENRLKELGYR